MRYIVTLSFICLATFRTLAQGVHLGAGDALEVGFSQMDCVFTSEPSAVAGTVYLFFGNDLLMPGERLRLEMFENTVSDTPLAVQTYSPMTPTTFVVIDSLNSWRDLQGVVRATVLDGSVDVSYADFLVRPDLFVSCRTIVQVPEPSIAMLLLLAALTGLVIWKWQKRGRQTHFECYEPEFIATKPRGHLSSGQCWHYRHSRRRQKHPEPGIHSAFPPAE